MRWLVVGEAHHRRFSRLNEQEGSNHGMGENHPRAQKHPQV